MSKIKLFKLETLDDGTQRFQSQLWIGDTMCNFIMRIDGIMMGLDYGDKGENFYPYNKPYEIVYNKSEMTMQEL